MGVPQDARSSSSVRRSMSISASRRLAVTSAKEGDTSQIRLDHRVREAAQIVDAGGKAEAFHRQSRRHSLRPPRPSFKILRTGEVMLLRERLTRYGMPKQKGNRRHR